MKTHCPDARPFPCKDRRLSWPSHHTFWRLVYSEPWSLAFHNTCLDRIPIVLSSLPSFGFHATSFWFLSTLRVLHCLLLVSGTDSIKEYTEKFTSLDDLRKHSQEIFDVYANADHVEELREPRQIAELKKLDRAKLQQELDSQTARANKRVPAGSTSATSTAPPRTSVPVPEPPIDIEDLPIDQRGDQVLENGKLFIRDALFTRLFTDAIKSGGFRPDHFGSQDLVSRFQR